MSCERLEQTTSALMERTGSAEEAEALRHSLGCEECAGAVRVIETLREDAAVAVPEPPPSYWRSFSGRIESRLPASTGAPAWLSMVTSWRALLALSLAAASLCVAVILVVRSAPLSRSERAASPSRFAVREAELLERLGQAPQEELDEVLNELTEDAPPEPSEDLVLMEIHLLDDEGPAYSDEFPYDLFLRLAEEERSRLLKEIRGEIG